MQRWSFRMSTLVILAACLPAQAQKLSQNDETTRALLDWGGTTASAVYGLVKADLARQVPGDRYEKLAREITYKIEAGRASSSLIQAPLDLTSSVLYTSAAIDPEPVSKAAALVGGYAAKKFGESIGKVVVDEANKQADSMLKRLLDENHLSIDDLDKIPPEKLTATLGDMMIGDKKLAEMLQDNPQSIKRIAGHAQDLRDAAQLSTLKNAKAIKGTVDQIAKDVNSVTGKIDSVGKEINNSLDAITGDLKDIGAALRQQSKDIEALQESVKGNSAAVHTLAQVSSMSWTTDQKLAALDNGLFSDLNQTQQEAMRKSLLSQQKTEAFVSKMQKTASALGAVANIAQQLGVDPKIVKAAQAGQIVSGALAAYASGNYLGAVTAVGSLLGLGSGASDGNAAMMSYMQAQFDKINQKLDVIIDLQKQTLQAVVVVSNQLHSMQVQLDEIYSAVAVSNLSLQYLLLEGWEPCQSIVNEMDNTSELTRETFLKIANSPERIQYLAGCYAKYSSYFTAHVSNSENNWGLLDLRVFPQARVYKNENEAKHYAAVVKKLNEAYAATKTYFMAAHGEAAGKSPATYLAALLDPKGSLIAAKARDERRKVAADKLAAFKCRQPGIIHAGIIKPLCQGQGEGEPPQESTVRVLLKQELAGPYAAKLIDVGQLVATWSTFAYQKGGKTSYVPAAGIINLPTRGPVGSLNIALTQGMRRNLLDKLEWLADGVLLQQSMLYGDFVAQLVVNELYDEKSKSLVAPAATEPLDSPKRLAFNAMQLNETLARNVVLIALRKSIGGDEGGTPQITTYEIAMGDMKGVAACTGTSTGAQYLKLLAPGWTFTRAETEEAKQADKSLVPCTTADPKTTVATGIGVKVGALFVKAPLPQALKDGELERPASLRLAQWQVLQLAEQKADLDASSLIGKDVEPGDMPFVRQLLASQCLNGRQCN